MISDDKLIKKYEGKDPKELIKAPIFALQGVSEPDAVRMKEAFGIDNIKEMANLRYYQRAKTIAQMAKEGKK